jgi:signal transduction histidine kinase/DNA-binding response OmpR family regulator
MDFLNSIDKDISLLLDNLPVGIVKFNEKSECIYINKFIKNLFGLDNLTSHSLDNLKNLYINQIHIDDRQQEIIICQQFKNDNQEVTSTFRIFNKYLNEYRWVTNKRTVINHENMISFIYTLQDIHENKILELKLRNETVKSEHAYTHQASFLANMSHEIRTPLNGIIGMLTLLEDTPLSDDQKDYMLMVKECSYNLMTIINDILDYSKLEVGKISLDIKPMDLTKCIESTNDIIMSKIYEKSLEYTYNTNPTLPNSIYGDSNRIKQILLNLLSNAIKFTDKGYIHLNINKINYLDYNVLKNKYDKSRLNDNIIENTIDSDNVYFNKIYLRFDIIDSGCGIDSNEINKLFKPFSQVINKVNYKIYQGTGLGLVISKELVELMGGFIWLDKSDLYKGTKFSFVLPTIECPTLNLNNNNNDNSNVLHNANVLIVDDNIHNRISLSGMITKWGMKPYVFSNAEEALYFTRLTNFDIGLIDICMPKMDGVTFASKLYSQKNFINNEFPLIALSSIGDKNSTDSNYFKIHLLKPIKESKLKNICINLLQNRKKNKLDNQVFLQNNNSCINLPIEQSSTDDYIIENKLDEFKYNIKILLAEDVHINQKVIISFLRKIGYINVDIVSNGEECIQFAKQNHYDIIFLDIRMPIKDGDVVLKELLEFYKNNKKTSPYFVAVTAYALKEDKDRYINLGFDDYIPKPITLNTLSKCIDKFIDQTLNT